MRILLAEDDNSIATILGLILSKVGNHHLDRAADGVEAIEFLKNNTYDLILLDGMMPKMSGLEVLTEIRAEGNTTPTILLSAKNDALEIKKFESMGAVHMAKPFDPTTICQNIEEITSNLKKQQAS